MQPMARKPIATLDRSTRPSPKVVPSLSRVRAAVSNGSNILGPDIDHRSASARRYRDIVDDLTNDRGGEGAVSEAERLLIRRAAMLALQLEMQEQGFTDMKATTAQVEAYQRGLNSLRRTLETLARGGLPRRPREVDRVPSVEQYAERLRNGAQQ